MAKIHGFVYIIIGIFVSVASWKINNEDLYLFFYAGILFMGVGVAKLLLSLIRNKKEGEKITHHKEISHHQTQHLQHYRRCRKCGSVMKANDRFCGRCGFRGLNPINAFFFQFLPQIYVNDFLHNYFK